MVNLYLVTGDNIDHAPFLAIPTSDIQWLSLSPTKWLDFVMFTICGIHGVLSLQPQGPPVQGVGSI